MNELEKEANLRHQNTVAEAEAAVARTQSQAREFVENTISSAQQAVGRSEQELQQRAQQYVREQENNLRTGMEQELSRLRGEAQDELARRERRIAELEARLHQQEALVESVPVTPKALAFTPQTQTGQVPLGSPPSNRSQHSEFPNPFACPQTGIGDQLAPPHTGSQQPPQGHPVAFQPPGYPGGMYGGLQMNPCGGSPQNGATPIDVQTAIGEELLRTRQLFDDFVNAMRPVLDVLTPEQRMQLQIIRVTLVC